MKSKKIFILLAESKANFLITLNMRKIGFVFLLLAMSFSKAYSQDWHKYNDTLKLPVNNSHYQISVGFFNRLDTVECKYKMDGGSPVFKGFKLVYVFDGYFIDTQNTIDVFFDDKKQRINNVKEYSFN